MRKLLSDKTEAELRADRSVLLRAKAVAEARESLASFMHIMMPDEEHPGDVALSEYKPTPPGKLLCAIIERTERGELKRVAVSIPPQHGKPVAEHELVLMGDGSRKPLREVAVGDTVVTHRGRAREVEAVYEQGVLPCLRVRTVTGRVVVAAPDHPFLTPEGWLQAKDLQVGMSLANVVPDAREQEGDWATARLLGYFVGDGSCTQNGATLGASITCVDGIERADIEACCAQLGFGVREIVSRGRAQSLSLSGGVRDFLRHHGLAGCGSYEKRVPEWVFRASTADVANFLGAYFACDGSVNRRGGARKDVCLEWYSVSRDLLVGVQHLLLRLGVQSRLGVKNGRYKGARHVSYRLSVTSQAFAARLLKAMPVHHAKAETLRAWTPVMIDFPTGLLADPIASIEDAGGHACRCLSVAEDRSFTAADLVVHNTIHLSTYGPAWIIGRNPRTRIVVATYNETRADELGEALRKVLTSDSYRQVFPEIELEKGSQSKSYMALTKGGKIFFVGAGGTITGRGADYFIIDDPMKDDEELQSDNFREKVWKWFYSVAYSRGNKRTRIIVLHTRWHADDLLGRLCDPTHPERKKRFKDIADDWVYLNISGVVQDQALADALGLTLEVPKDPKVIKAFGEKPMAALWEEDKDLPFFAQWKIGEPRTFSALVMGQPTVEDGEYFKAEHIKLYDLDDLPENLRKYGGSDHAVSLKARRDYTVMGCVGVDEKDNIWVLPDLTWDRIETDRTVEELLYYFKTHRPQLWWMESEMISKSFGPFLKKRMLEERIYTTLQPVTPSKDKPTRARSIQGRMSMGKIFFPRFAPWWNDARSELLTFPHGAHDDFVDWLSHIGNGLLQERRASSEPIANDNVVRVGSPEWIVKAALRRAKYEQRHAAGKGW